MEKTICYMGDGDISGAAAYLCGVMSRYGLPHDYVPSAECPGDDFLRKRYGLYVLSDYPAEKLGEERMRRVLQCAREGSGLLMIGGWESFHGARGGYHESPLAEALPVEISSEDDRTNSPGPCLIRKRADHEILEGLPFDSPPGIGGFNRFTAKEGAEVLLSSLRFDVRIAAGGDFEFLRAEEAPLLVVGSFGEGRTAALATDVAPHWVGGFVDWGDARVIQEVGGGRIEVGNWYAEFFRNLLTWTGRIR